MPCTECKDGKYKWGETGECKYDTLEECKDANPDYHYEDEKATRIVELVITDENQDLAIDAISLVTAPAIEQDFVYFGKDKNNLTFAKVDEEKRMLKMRIDNDELWNKIKDGELKGLSIEGYFTDRMENMSTKTPTDAEILKALNEIINENQTK